MGTGGASLIGRPEKSSMAGACLYNGMIAHAEELDDSHRYVSGLHPGAVVIPPALAAAEDDNLGGPAFIKAVIAGYEAASRVCRCLDQGHRRRGFHSTGTMGPFGSCAAAGLALGLDENAMTNALGLAGSTSAGLFAFLEDGAAVKHFHTGRAALDGLLAALLAREGLTGPAGMFEAREGFFRAYADEYDQAPLFQPLEKHEICNAYHKLHSACGHSFPAIDAALELRAMLGGHWEKINRLELRTYHAASVLNNPRPGNPQEARFSIPFLTGLALVKGRVVRSDMTLETINDKDITELAGRTEVVEDQELQNAFPALRAGILRADLEDGQTVYKRVDAPRGMPDNPVSYDELCDKFHAQASGILTGSRRGKSSPR